LPFRKLRKGAFFKKVGITQLSKGIFLQKDGSAQLRIPAKTEKDGLMQNTEGFLRVFGGNPG
jgi:hypothetical protein